MLVGFLALSSSFVTFVSAWSLPVVIQAEPDVGDWCHKLGGDTTDNLDNFTLSAWNPAGNNLNTTGVPLVLSTTGSTGGFSTHTWATWNSYPYNTWPSFSITEGGIKANGPGRSVVISAASGSPVVFLTTNIPPERAPAQMFCVVPNNDISGEHPHPYLAVHGRYDKWFLCAKTYRPDLTVWRVVYDAAAGAPSYDYTADTCYPVLLNVVT